MTTLLINLWFVVFMSFLYAQSLKEATYKDNVDKIIVK